MRGSKYTYLEKIEMVEEFKHSELSLAVFEKQHGLSKMCLRRWLDLYEAEGFNGLKQSRKSRRYTEKFKAKVVQAYLDGKGSMDQLKIEFGLRSASQVSNWVSRYNGRKQKTVNAAGKKAPLMPRKTTLEERITLVEFVERDHHTYKQAAERFAVSYQQARSWVHKFREGGNEALVDNRGHHKTDSERTEKEKLQRENRQLRAKLANHELLEAFAKKFLEIQRKEQTRNK